MRAFLTLVAGALVLSACGAPFVANMPAKGPPPKAYTYQGLAATTDPRNTEATLILVAFSGGGTRAAALAFGVLEVLHNTHIRPVDGAARTLLTEVDAISSNSGGSFAAAFYGIHRKKMFIPGTDGVTPFETRMLKRDLQGALSRNLLTRIIRVSTRTYNRSDIAAETYDTLIFGGARYRDMQRQGRPFIVINAHDTTKYSRFVFTQPQFDLLCSDLAPYPLARAVTASSAVHGVFAPIKLRNYGGKGCVGEPAWVGQMLDRSGPPSKLLTSRRQIYRLATTARWYRQQARNAKAGPYYVHLADGGAMDNTGIDALLFGLQHPEAGWGLPQALRRGRIRRVVMIVVNATPRQSFDTDLRPGGPQLPRMLLSAVHSSIRAKTEASIREAQRAMAQLRKQHGHRGVRFYGPMMVEFDRIADTRRRTCFNNIKTALTLPGVQVDALRAEGRRQLLANPAFRRLVHDLRGKTAPLPPVKGAAAFCKS